MGSKRTGKLRRGPCAYCGEPASTRDHVPSRKLFPRPLPDDLITVPSCDPCNNHPSDDEEYVLHVLLSFREADTPFAQALRDQLFAKNKTERRVRIAHQMLSATHVVNVVSESGVPLGRAPALTIDTERVGRVMEKITRGLYFHAFNERPPKERASTYFLPNEPAILQTKAVQQAITLGSGRQVGQGAFEYYIARASDAPGVALCVMLFLRSVWVVSTLHDPANG